MDRFIALSGRGDSSWWRYALSLAVIGASWLGLGSIPLILVMVLNGGAPFPWGGNPPVQGPLSGLDPFFTFYLPVSFSFIALGLSLAFAVRFIHGRPVSTLISRDGRFDRQRFLKGFALFIALNAAGNLAGWVMDPSAVSLSFDPARLALLAPVYAALTLVQTSSEEMLFRGYLLQGAGSILRNPLAGALVSSLLFMLVHAGNPETANGLALALAYYFCVGFWLSMITLADGRLEMAVGAHSANNLFILLLNYDTSALEVVPSVFKLVRVSESDLAASLLIFSAFAILSFLALFPRRAKDGAKARDAKRPARR